MPNQRFDYLIFIKSIPFIFQIPRCWPLFSEPFRSINNLKKIRKNTLEYKSFKNNFQSPLQKRWFFHRNNSYFCELKMEKFNIIQRLYDFGLTISAF